MGRQTPATEPQATPTPAEGVVVTDAPEAGTGQAVNAATGQVTEPGQALPPVVNPDPEVEPDPDPPVYDERGNVRPRGTPGAKPMTKAERTDIARRLASGEVIKTTAMKSVKTQEAQAERDAKARKAELDAKAKAEAEK
jgi:hypothetical protein